MMTASPTSSCPENRDTALLSILLGVFAMLGVCLTVPALRELFRFGPLHLDDLALAIASAAFILVALELLKPFWRTRFRSASSGGQP
jgi:Ca2+-transporting ATPase